MKTEKRHPEKERMSHVARREREAQRKKKDKTTAMREGAADH